MAKKEAAKKDAVGGPVKHGDAGKQPAKKSLAKKTSAKKEPAVKTAAEAPAASAKKAQPVLTTTDIGDHLAATFDIPKSHAKIYLNEAIALIGKHLKKGARIRMSGFGVFEVKKRAARKGRNPATGDEIKIKATKRVVFAAARDLKVKL